MAVNAFDSEKMKGTRNQTRGMKLISYSKSSTLIFFLFSLHDTDGLRALDWSHRIIVSIRFIDVSSSVLLVFKYLKCVEPVSYFQAVVIWKCSSHPPAAPGRTNQAFPVTDVVCLCISSPGPRVWSSSVQWKLCSRCLQFDFKPQKLWITAMFESRQVVENQIVPCFYFLFQFFCYFLPFCSPDVGFFCFF